MTKEKRFVLPAAVLVIAVIGCIVFAYMRSVTAETRDFVFYGTAEAEQIDISAEVNGKIKEIKVREGQMIEVGSLLAVIDAPENLIKAERYEISVESAENELKKLEEGNREEEINIQRALVKQGEAAVRQAENNLKQGSALAGQAEQSLKSAQEDYSLKKDRYDDIKALFENGAISQQDLRNAEYAMNTAAYATESAKHSLDSAGAQLASAEAQLEGAASQLAASREKLTMLINGATERTINASEYGVEQAE